MRFNLIYRTAPIFVDDAAVALRDWAASGDYQLVIAHGSQYGPIVEELATEFPELSFAWGTRQDTFGLDNVYSYAAASDEGGYYNGVLAAHLTESRVIGLVGPIEVGDGKLYADGFAMAWHRSTRRSRLISCSLALLAMCRWPQKRRRHISPTERIS